MIEVLDDFGFGQLDINHNDFLKPNNVIQLGYPPVRIALLTSIDGVEFSLAYSRKEEVDIEGEDLFYINLEDLIKNKKASGRLQDKADIKELNKLRKGNQ